MISWEPKFDSPPENDYPRSPGKEEISLVEMQRQNEIARLLESALIRLKWLQEHSPERVSPELLLAIHWTTRTLLALVSFYETSIYSRRLLTKSPK